MEKKEHRMKTTTWTNKKHTLHALSDYFSNDMFSTPSFTFDYDMARYVQTSMKLHRHACFGFEQQSCLNMVWSSVIAASKRYPLKDTESYFYPTAKRNPKNFWSSSGTYPYFRLTHYEKTTGAQ